MFNQEINNTLISLHNASIIHKSVRKYIKPYLKSDIKLVDIARLIEFKTMELSNNMTFNDNKFKSINYGIGFPSSLSLNNVAAHFHPHTNYDTIQYNHNTDILKIDFGTEVNGWIIDSAFTISGNKKFNNLIESVKKGIYHGVLNAHIDQSINDWGESVQEVIESYELEYNGNYYPIKVIENLSGHSINRNGVIHGDIRLSPYKTDASLGRFKDSVYAIEALAVSSDDNKYINNLPTMAVPDGEVSLYSLNPHRTYTDELIFYNRFKYLPFTKRYLTNNELKLIKTNKDIINEYKPLLMPDKCYVSHFEHTLYLGLNNNGKEEKIIFSYDEDY